MGSAGSHRKSVWGRRRRSRPRGQVALCSSQLFPPLPSGWRREGGDGDGTGGDLAGSPQHREVHSTEAGLLTQLPVGVVAHPRVVVGLPAEEGRSARVTRRPE